MTLLKALINFLKINKFFPQVYYLIYPVALLPQREFSLKISIDTIGKEEENLCLVRRSLKAKSEMYDSLGGLRDDVFITGYKEIPRNSMNILCNSFKAKHIKFIPKGYGSTEWAGNDINIELIINELKIDKRKPPIYFLLEDLHGKKFPFKKNLKKHPELRKELEKLTTLLKIDENEFATLDGISYITHTPTNSNYWHVEFCLKDMQTNKEVGKKQIESYKEDKSVDEQHWTTQAAYHALYDIIKPSAKERTPNYLTEIPKRYYLLS